MTCCSSPTTCHLPDAMKDFGETPEPCQAWKRQTINDDDFIYNSNRRTDE